MTRLKHTTLYIKGMHCPSCEVLLTDKCRELGNVAEAKADHKRQKVEIAYRGRLDIASLDHLIEPFGYRVGTKDEIADEPWSKKIIDATAVMIIILSGYFVLREFVNLPSIGGDSSLNYSGALILGVVASTSTCMATTGALFLATIGKLNSRGRRFIANILPAVYFILGRLISYIVFGFALGLIGKTVASSFELSSALSLFVAFSMLLIGLDMLKIIRLSSLLPVSFSTRLFSSVENRLIKQPQKTAFLLGAITYFLPCGFTQTVQVYSLGLADPWKSAATMGFFALGTIPAILTVGFLSSSFAKTSWYPLFNKLIGGLIFLIGLIYFINGLALYGLSFSFGTSDKAHALTQTVPVAGGYQIVKMSVVSSGYRPNQFVIRQGIPVRWQITGENVFGCQAYLVAPKIGVEQVIRRGENIIEFVAKSPGKIPFSCGMGMYRGEFTVI